MARRGYLVLQGRHLSRRSSCTRSSPTWPASGSRPAITRVARRRAADQGDARPVQPDGSTAHVRFTHLEGRPLADRPRPLPRQLGDPATATGRPSSAASSRRTRGCAPTSRTTTSGFEVPYRYGLETPRSTCPTSSSWSTTATATTTCCNLVVEIKGYRGEDAKEKKRHDGHLLGAGRQQPRHVRPLGVRRVQGWSMPSRAISVLC